MKTLADFQELVDRELVIYLQDDVGEEMLKSWHDQLKSLRSRRDRQIKEDIEPDFRPGAKIAIVVMTNGGGLDIGNALIQEIRSLDSIYDVWIVCQTVIISMGTYLILSVPIERRVAFEGVDFYCHRSRLSRNTPTSGHQDSHDYAVKESQASISAWKKKDADNHKLMSKQTLLTLDEVKNLIEKPRHFGTTKAKKIGLISHVLK